jgi:polyphosphate kinase
MPRILLNDPRYYLNRHVQWLDFNRRLLEEARDPGNPLLERVKFLAITANNLDEFVEVRVAVSRRSNTVRLSAVPMVFRQKNWRWSAREMHTLVRDQYSV